MYGFQKIRSCLFYLSLFLFFAGLPFILSFALGYKFNAHSLKFVKTGLIFIKTQPAAAKIYINGKLFSEKSPASIHELLPGTYKVALELANHYPWKAEVEVEAGKTSRVDKVILFPVRPNLQQLNQEKFSSFRIDVEKKIIYYLDQEKKVVYRSNLDANNFEDIASLPDKFAQIDGWEISPDKRKLFIFNQYQINISFFDNQVDYEYPVSPVFLEYRQNKIIDVFWHSDSYHLVVLTDKNVQVVESRQGALPINLVELNRGTPGAFYDVKEDVLYFGDRQRSADGSFYNNLYKLELSANLYLLERLIAQPFGQAKSAQNGEAVE
ncbi:MAG: PEGA domain-containing protein [Candidatus Omnitrophica bacterium]|nr:PEGA domain-containing protein [Candidatus Omnitrophota bacterium]